MANKLPRPGTRVRALFDLLCKYPHGIMWAEAKDAYDNAPPAYNHKLFGPRYHSNMEIGKLLKKFCFKDGTRGKFVYRLKPEWAQVAVANPFYAIATKADESKLRKIANEIMEGLEELKKIPQPPPVLPPESVYNPDGIRVGDWVQVRDINSEQSRPLRANGIGAGTYSVEKVERGFVWLHGCNGGWEPRRFKIITRPSVNQPSAGPQLDKGAPEIRDMAWGSVSPKFDIENPTIVHLNSKVSQLKDELQTLSQELLACEKNSNEYKDQIQYLRDKTAEWVESINQAREQLDRLQHSEVGQVYSACGDLDSFLQNLQDDIRET